MKIWRINNYNYFYKYVLDTEKDKIDKLLKNKDKFYTKYFELPKKNGVRLIYSLDSNDLLYKVQKNVYNNFLINIITSDNAFGFKKSFNYLDFLTPHTSYLKNNYYLRMDIKNFFESISYDLVREVLKEYFVISDNLSKKQKQELTNILMEIITYKKQLVQGLSTSPIVSNIIFRQLDIRIEKYCQKFDVVYTRYADDMLFSSYKKKVHSDPFFNGISRILRSKGFLVNYDKTLRFKNILSLNGFVVSDKLTISREKMKFINAIFFFFNIKKNISETIIEELNVYIKNIKIFDKEFNSISELLAYLCGYRAFLIMIIKYENEINNNGRLEKAVSRIEKIVKLFPEKTL